MPTPRLGPLRGGGFWGSVAVIVVYPGASASRSTASPTSSTKPCSLTSPTASSRTALPVFYNGEFRPQTSGCGIPRSTTTCSRLRCSIWGMSPFAVRAFGAICVIASFFFSRSPCDGSRRELKQYGYVALAALFLLNPLVISDASVPDIDGTARVSWSIDDGAVARDDRRAGAALLAAGARRRSDSRLLAVSTKFTIAAIVAVIVGMRGTPRADAAVAEGAWVVVAFAAGTALLARPALRRWARSLKFDARGPFDYLFGSLGSRPPGRRGTQRTIVHLIGGPGGRTSSGSVRRSSRPPSSPWSRILIARSRADVSGVSPSSSLGSSLAIVIGYSYISASPFGFPKYTRDRGRRDSPSCTALVLALCLAGSPPARRRTPATRRCCPSPTSVVLVVGPSATHSRWRRGRGEPPQPVEYLTRRLDRRRRSSGVAIATAVFVMPARPGWIQRRASGALGGP